MASAADQVIRSIVPTAGERRDRETPDLPPRKQHQLDMLKGKSLGFLHSIQFVFDIMLQFQCAMLYISSSR